MTFKKLIVVIFAASLITMSIVYYFFIPKKAADVAPNQLLGMEGVVVLQGNAAIEKAKASHLGKLRFVQDVAIVRYGPVNDDFILLWVTLYPNHRIAYNETERMARAMVRFGKGWATNLKKLEVKGKTIYQTSPDRGLQYFWVDGRYMFYMIQRNLNQSEIAEVIETL